ncbi:hypothetical protein [Cellulomonas soli]|uniref:Uncharacterized protein n=1 Tax=Cellulomonas soli TaxID=931535 RepID=A0A512PE67_9CELL|nr:hypothetical protein [Cellulomonas soli]NYI59000.1 hypothetical protein [Cellulomonas soli]GEP69507.1 hypothetical protein CSO01_22220 [Cellulomonas soli]
MAVGVALVAVGVVAVSDDWVFWGERVRLSSGVEHHLNGAVVVVGAVAGDDARAEVTVTRGGETVTDVLGPGEQLRVAWWGTLTVREVEYVGSVGEVGGVLDVVVTTGS